MLALAVFFMVLVALATAGQVYLVKPAFDELLDSRDTFWVWVVPVGFVAAGLITGVANMAQSLLMQRIGLRVVQAMQQQMFSTILRADLSYLQETGTSRQLSRFTTDMYMLRDVVIKALTGIGRDVLKVVVLSGLMIYQNWQMALAALVFFPLCVFPIVRIGRLLRKISTQSLGEQGQMTAVIDDALKGARQVKAYNMYTYEEGRAGNAFETVFLLAFKSARTRAFSYPILDTLVGVCMAAVLVWGGFQIKAGETTVGAFMSFFAAVLAAYQPARGLASMNATLQEGLAAARRCFSVIDYRPSIVNRPGATELSSVSGEVAFRNVDFTYDGETPVLKDINLDVKAGETVALVGRSGGGKSTILNLVPRFYDISAGEIFIDGAPARDVTLESLRANIGLVTQETLLFNDTIRANIAYGRLDATQEEIEQAARNAAAHDFIVELPDGYNTLVGEHGLRLSGGQRQRVAIARAMLKNAPILLLDEATSALDTESERIVQEALSRLMQGRTTIVIAHRLSTVMHANRIYVLDKGCIEEVGTHSELVAKGGLYAQLSKIQFDQPDGETVDIAAVETPAGADTGAEQAV
ncbi:ABC transporter ATP-binding protein [Hwanghaeella grinnelliae]|uniref:ABC transporter ATP-binding protein n=2 Tax=Hwanghaeella grinnelliae TaxID=2500179 RepID=A0A437QR53_9PROT|nr:ABC transporter ATP-binding protein [Hwanghaeella grinnelliae]